MKFEIKENSKFCIASDTDSAYFNAEPFLIKKWGENYKKEIQEEEILNEVKSIIKKYSEKLNKEYLNILAKDYFNIKKHKFDWKTETILKSALWTGKRRYAQLIIEKEGVKIPEDNENSFDLKGIEMMKSSMNLLFKKFGEDFIKKILKGVPKENLDKSIIDFWKNLKTLDPKSIGKPTGVSFINKCIKRPPTLGEIFSDLNINTKENSRAAIYYNDLLRFKKLDKKFESIIETDKIYVINLKKNPYNINVIGLPNNKIPKEIEDFIKEYIDVEQIFESSISKKLRELYSDLGWEYVVFNEKVSKFFKWS